MWDLTRLTVDEFPALVPPVEDTFWGSMADWRLHGRRRQARRSTTEKTCPPPAPEDRRLGLRGYRPQPPPPRRHGRVGGLRPSTAPPWMHVVRPV